MPNITVTHFVRYIRFLSRPLHDDRFAAPVRALMGKTVQTTASSAADRGQFGRILLPHSGVLGRMQRLRKCEHKSFRFCGKEFEQDEDFGTRVTAKENTERAQPVACDAKHGLTRKATASEVHQLRSVTQSLAWIARQTRPDFSYRISKIQSTFENVCVKDVRERNRIIEYAMSRSTRCRHYTLSRAHFAEDVLREHLHILQKIFCLVMFHRRLIDVPDFSSFCCTPPL